ncbi:MAG: DMT family transporter [Desulfobacteraceae bacterium]
MEKLPFVLLVIGAAIANGFQAPINAALSKFTGTVESSCISFSVGALSLFVLSVIIGRGSILKFAQAPPYLWIGGFVGALLVTVMLIVVTKIGAAVTISSVITGQMIAGLIIDQIGFLGVPKNPIDVYRVGGIVFLAIGIRLLMK